MATEAALSEKSVKTGGAVPKAKEQWIAQHPTTNPYR
jgi:hypothetical protein